LHGYEPTQFSRAIDLSCAPPDAKPGVEGCIALVRYRGKLIDNDAAETTVRDVYGNVLFVRTDAAGHVVWKKVLMSGFDPISEQTGGFIDDELRVRLLGTGEFLVTGTYEGRVYIGNGTNAQELGPSHGRSLMMIEFHADGTFDNWDDNGTPDNHDQRALAVVELPDTRLALAGTCHGDVPLDQGSYPCGPQPTAYLFFLAYDGSTLGGSTFPASTKYNNSNAVERPSQVVDLVTDPSGAVWVSGTFEASMQVGTSTPDVSAGEDDGFLMKLAPDGTRAWITTASGLGHERGGRVARVPGGTLWTSRVSLGGSVGAVPFAEAGHVIAKVSDTGAVLWALPVPAARGALPLGVAAAADGSFALYGEGFLGRFDANGNVLWQGTGPDVRGAAFTSATPAQLVVAANVLGTTLFGASVSTGPEGVLRGALVAFPPGK
jgi:hypothetical protein